MWWTQTNVDPVSFLSDTMSREMTRSLSSLTMCLHWKLMLSDLTNPTSMDLHHKENDSKSFRTLFTILKSTLYLCLRLVVVQSLYVHHLWLLCLVVIKIFAKKKITCPSTAQFFQNEHKVVLSLILLTWKPFGCRPNLTFITSWV